MDVVVFSGEDHTPRLQPTHKGRWGLHVRPHVELVGQKSSQAQEEREDPEEIPVVHTFQGHYEPHDEHKGKARKAVVAVGVDEVVADDPRRVDVVLAKRLDEVRPEDRGLVRTEVVGEEVYEPREEVSSQICQYHQYRRKPQIAKFDHSPVDVYSYQR